MLDVILVYFLHIPVCGLEENIAADKPVGGVPDSYFGTESAADGAGFTERENIRFLTKCQQMSAGNLKFALYSLLNYDHTFPELMLQGKHKLSTNDE
jgi:hypothetical protein